jgi:hypothetical protein
VTIDGRYACLELQPGHIRFLKQCSLVVCSLHVDCSLHLASDNAQLHFLIVVETRIRREVDYPYNNPSNQDS